MAFFNKKTFFAYGHSVFLRCMGAFFVFLLTVLVNNIFDKNDAGYIFIGIYLVSFSALISQCGLDTATLKFVAQLNSTAGNNSKHYNYLKQALKITSYPAFFITLAIIIVLAFLAPQKPVYYKLMLVIPAIIPFTYNRIITQALFALNKYNSASFFQTAFIPGAACATVLLLYFAAPAAKTTYFLSFYTLICLISCAWVYYIIPKHEVNGFIPYKQILKVSIPMLTIALANISLEFTDKFMIGYFCGIQELPVYEAIKQSSRAGELLLVACNSLLAPQFVKLWETNKIRKLKSHLTHSIYFLTILAIIMFAGYWVLGYLFMELNNINSPDAVTSLRILIFGQVFVLATGPVAYLLMMTGREKWHQINVITVALLNIPLNYYFINQYNYKGAIIATVICLMIKNITSLILAYYHLRTKLASTSGR